MSIFNDFSVKAASMALDGLSARQRAIAHNVANVDTPNYKAQRVHFEDALRAALRNEGLPNPHLQVTRGNHIQVNDGSGSSVAHVVQDNTTYRNDDNNVDIDLEMTRLSETAVRYQALTQIAGQRLALLKSLTRDAR